MRARARLHVSHLAGCLQPLGRLPTALTSFAFEERFLLEGFLRTDAVNAGLRVSLSKLKRIPVRIHFVTLASVIDGCYERDQPPGFSRQLWQGKMLRS